MGLSRQLLNPVHTLERLLKQKLPLIRESADVEVTSGQGSNDKIRFPDDAVSLHSLKRLNAEDVARIATYYKDGQTTIQLAEQFDVNRRTISKVLSEKGVALRGRPLTEKQIDEAVRLYELGLSLAKVGTIVGAQARTVQLRLRERGVTMRDTHGRPRSSGDKST